MEIKMKKYMVITRIDGNVGSRFFDDSEEAEQYRMDCECGCGGFAQVYKWFPKSRQYKLWYE